MRLAAVLAGTAAIVLAYGMFLGVRRGEKVEAAAVADFNNNGTADVVYWFDPTGGGGRNMRFLGFADGSGVRKRGDDYFVGYGQYERHARGEAFHKRYDVSAWDVNGDGNMDLVLKDPDLLKDAMLYSSARQVLIGDGRGNFTPEKMGSGR